MKVNKESLGQTKRPEMIQMFRSGASAKETKKRRKRKKKHRDIKKGSRILLCLPLM
jgi:hypothetical protein